MKCVHQRQRLILTFTQIDMSDQLVRLAVLITSPPYAIHKLHSFNRDEIIVYYHKL